MEKAIRGVISVSRDQVLLLIKGIVLGMGIIIPGISGGTIMMAFGMYEKMLEDVLKLRIKPYITIGLGALLGVFTGSIVFTYMFEFYRNPTSAFVLGCLLMSIPFILKRSKGYGKRDVSLFVIGAILAFVLMEMPALLQGGTLSNGHIFLSGFVSSSTMMIPGVSGSAVLIILGVYEEVLMMINAFQIADLAIFVMGAIVGIFVLAKILKALFTRNETQIMFFFSGLILGSSRILLPSAFDLLTFLSLLLGIGLVYKWGNYKYRKNAPFLGRTLRRLKNMFKR